MIETVFTVGGLALVVWVIADLLRPSKAKGPPPAPAAQQQFGMGQEINGAFDAVALQKARHMMNVIRSYPDEQSKVLALAHELHRDRAREMNQTDRQGQELQSGLNVLKEVLGAVSPIINHQRQIPVNNNDRWERY